MTSFSSVCAHLPQFASYLSYPTADQCLHKMIKKKDGKIFIQFFKEASSLKIGALSGDQSLKKLLEKAVELKNNLPKISRKKFKETRAAAKKAEHAYTKTLRKEPKTEPNQDQKDVLSAMPTVLLAQQVMLLVDKKMSANCTDAVRFLLALPTDVRKNVFPVCVQQHPELVNQILRSSKGNIPTVWQKLFQNKIVQQAVKSLDLSEIRFEKNIFEKILSLFPYINDLKIKKCKLTNEDTKIIIERIKNLTSLDITENWLDVDALRVIIESGNMKNLSSLHADWNNFGIAGACLLATSENVKNLTSLSIQWNIIGEVGACAIAKSENLKSLTNLNLAWNGISAVGARAIIESPQLKALSVVNLKNNRLDEAEEQEMQKIFGNRGKVLFS